MNLYFFPPFVAMSLSSQWFFMGIPSNDFELYKSFRIKENKHFTEFSLNKYFSFRCWLTLSWGRQHSWQCAFSTNTDSWACFPRTHIKSWMQQNVLINTALEWRTQEIRGGSLDCQPHQWFRKRSSLRTQGGKRSRQKTVNDNSPPYTHNSFLQAGGRLMLV